MFALKVIFLDKFLQQIGADSLMPIFNFTIGLNTHNIAHKNMARNFSAQAENP